MKPNSIRASTFRCLVVMSFAVLASGALAQGYGRFVGDVIARWEADGRLMTLVEPFQYIDGRGRKWKVPRGVAIDGASIPSIFWSVIGSPFEGKYRNASVIHDYFCETRSRRWEDVHRAFYEAMLASGVGGSKAMLMYKAVERFGPRWPEPQVKSKCRKPNGDVDFSKCAENSAVEQSSIEWPKASDSEIYAFLDEMKGIGDSDDLEKIRAQISR